MIAAIALEDSVDPRTASSAERRCWDNIETEKSVSEETRKPVEAINEVDVIT